MKQSMFKKLKIYGVMFLCVLGTIISCTPRSYDYNAAAVPIGLNYSYYNYGTGTSFTSGALIINIRSNPNNTINYNEYYLIQIYGVGTYTLQSGYNQLFVPNIWANYYNFSVEKVCTAANNSNCTPRTLTGLATINTEMTTVVDAWL